MQQSEQPQPEHATPTPPQSTPQRDAPTLDKLPPAAAAQAAQAAADAARQAAEDAAALAAYYIERAAAQAADRKQPAPASPTPPASDAPPPRPLQYYQRTGNGRTITVAISPALYADLVQLHEGRRGPFARTVRAALYKGVDELHRLQTLGIRTKREQIERAAALDRAAAEAATRKASARAERRRIRKGGAPRPAPGTIGTAPAAPAAFIIGPTTPDDD